MEGGQTKNTGVSKRQKLGRELSLQGSLEAIVFLSYRLPVRDTGETTEEEAHLLPVLALLRLPKQPCFAWLWQSIPVAGVQAAPSTHINGWYAFPEIASPTGW